MKSQLAFSSSRCTHQAGRQVFKERPSGYLPVRIIWGFLCLAPNLPNQVWGETQNLHAAGAPQGTRANSHGGEPLLSMRSPSLPGIPSSPSLAVRPGGDVLLSLVPGAYGLLPKLPTLLSPQTFESC